MTTRVLIVAGSSQRRAELERMLSSAPATRVVGVLPAIAGARTYVDLWRPDAVLIDLDPNQQNLQPLTTTFLADFSGPALVLLANHPQPNWIARALDSGVASILRRDSSAEQIAAALRAAAKELIVLGPEVAEGLLEAVRSAEDLSPNLHSPEHIEPLIEELTRRELEVLRMVAAGLGNREIALRLGISEHTAKFHISSILGKFGASSRTEAVTQGIKRGLILL